MKIYIASHCVERARFFAKELAEIGYEIVSRWHGPAFEQHPPESKLRGLAIMDVDDVRRCNVLVLIAGAERYPGGKFVEAGIALGLGKRVHIHGHRENVLMWHPAFSLSDDMAGLKRELALWNYATFNPFAMT